MATGQLDDHGQYGLIISRILIGTALGFVQTKCSLCWRTERCGSLIWNYCPSNLQEKRRCLVKISLHRKNFKKLGKQYFCFVKISEKVFRKLNLLRKLKKFAMHQYLFFAMAMLANPS